MDQVLFRLPAGAQGGLFFGEIRQLAVDVLDTALVGFVSFLLQGRPFDFQLAQTPLEFFEFRWHGIDGRAQLGTRLIHAINGLVGHKAVGDVPIRQACCRHEGRITDAHPVVNLVTLF